MATKKHPYHQYSPDARALDIAGDKWCLLIVRELLGGSARPAELRERLRGIPAESLRTRLNEMQASGLITRARFRVVPPRVDYTLTRKGRELAPVLAALADWGMVHAAHEPVEGEADADGSAALRLADGLAGAAGEHGDTFTAHTLRSTANALGRFANRGEREALAA